MIPENLPYSLAGYGVVVTGGSSGIGRAIALTAARAGAHVAVTFAHDEGAAHETAALVQASGQRAGVTRLDLADAAHLDQQLADVTRTAQQSLGRIDAWINNAGADILTGTVAQLSTTASSTSCSQSTSGERSSRRGMRWQCSLHRNGGAASST